MTSEGAQDQHLERILGAIETVQQSLSMLREKRSLSEADFRANNEAQDIVERRFVKVTEASVDISREILKLEGETVPGNNAAVFERVGSMGVLSDEVVQKMIKAAKFRNVLAHTYGDIIEVDTVYAALWELNRYRLFVNEITYYLEESGRLDTN